VSLSIFTYHYVRPVAGSFYPRLHALEASMFRRHLDYLRDHYAVITMDQFLDAVYERHGLPPHAALLTFDDGYLDHFDSVFPLLQAYGFTGTFFIPWQITDGRNVLDVNKIHFILAAADTTGAVVARLFNVLETYRDGYELMSDAEYTRRFAQRRRFADPDVAFVKGMLQRGLPQPVRAEIVDLLFREFVNESESELAGQLYMTSDEILYMQRAGMHIGNHGFAHLRYTTLSREDLYQDIMKSLGAMRKYGVYKKDWVMCYPYGEYTEEHINILEGEGCAAAFTTRGGITDVAWQGRFELARFDANDLTAELLRVRRRAHTRSNT